ncbi:hypothetical protein PDE_07565 [Penicillium oxalicum 114-2]|uniref:Uncharacterized protein n=1 Tax=Penicillium oxalicum (strain 114-2 / CGMCC 5302) TaxID=933388 RepID=S7ZPF8_PENO1|nr:hypothetical protein PDE_07565 [Penicillium oxalicum 114-2]
MHGWRVPLPDPCNCRGEQADVSTQTTLRVGGNSHARMNVIVRETRVKQRVTRNRPIATRRARQKGYMREAASTRNLGTNPDVQQSTKNPGQLSNIRQAFWRPSTTIYCQAPRGLADLQTDKRPSSRRCCWLGEFLAKPRLDGDWEAGFVCIAFWVNWSPAMHVRLLCPGVAAV